jgi:hypothetical protein
MVKNVESKEMYLKWTRTRTGTWTWMWTWADEHGQGHGRGCEHGLIQRRFVEETFC